MEPGRFLAVMRRQLRKKNALLRKHAARGGGGATASTLIISLIADAGAGQYEDTLFVFGPSYFMRSSPSAGCDDLYDSNSNSNSEGRRVCRSHKLLAGAGSPSVTKSAEEGLRGLQSRHTRIRVWCVRAWVAHHECTSAWLAHCLLQRPCASQLGAEGGCPRSQAQCEHL